MRSSASSKRGYLIIVSIGVLLAYTLASTSLYSIDATDLGLISRLPICFWTGLVLLGYLWYVSKQSKHYLVAAFVFTLSFLYVAPAVIKVPVWLSNSYYPFGESVLINSSGRLANRVNAPLFSYHDWPLFLYLASAFALVTGIAHSLLLKCFPLLTISLYGLLTMLILRSKMQTKYAVFGAAWFLSSFWLRQQYFGPQSIAYVFFLLILLILSWISFTERTKKATLLTLYIFLFLVVTATHVLTTFLLIMVVSALYVAQRFVFKKPSTLLVELCVFSIVVFLTYNIFLFPGFFKFAVHRFHESLLGVMGISLYREPSRIVGSSANLLSYVSSWSIVFVNVIIAAIGLVPELKTVLSRKQTSKQHEYSIFCGISLAALASYALTIRYGNQDAFHRAFMFGLPPLAYICVSLLKNRLKILVAVLAILIFLNIPAQYGSDSFRLATSTELAGARFSAVYSPQNTSFFDDLSLYIRYYDPLKNTKFESLIALPFTSFPNSTKVEEAVNEVSYVLRSDLQDNYYLYYLGKNPLDQVSFAKFSRIYDNGDFFAFKHPNETSSM